VAQPLPDSSTFGRGAMASAPFNLAYGTVAWPKVVRLQRFDPGAGGAGRPDLRGLGAPAGGLISGTGYTEQPNLADLQCPSRPELAPASFPPHPLTQRAQSCASGDRFHGQHRWIEGFCPPKGFLALKITTIKIDIPKGYEKNIKRS